MSHKTALKNLIFEKDIKVMVEVGVCRGALCRSLNHNCFGQIQEYWAIDPWQHMGKGHGKSSRYNDDRWEDLYLRNCERMLERPALRVIRSFSLTAVKIFPNEYFDFVYLDASHQYEDVVNDIHAWYPKVKKDGIFGGHDYYKKTTGVWNAVNEYVKDFWEEEDTVWLSVKT